MKILKKLPRLPRFTDEAQKRAAANIIKFMALLLVITIIARGTSGATLARVDVSATQRSEILDAVTGTATVSARDTLDVMAPMGLTIVEMFAGTGQNIIIGEPLARFDEDEVEEKLARETASLEKQLIELEKLERSDTVDNSSVKSAEQNVKRAQDDYNTTKTEGEADVAAAWDEYIKAANTSADAAGNRSVSSAQTTLKHTQEDRDARKKEEESAFKTLNSAKDRLKQTESHYYAIKDDEDFSNDEIAAALKAYEDARGDRDRAQTAHDNAESALQNLERSLENAKTTYNNAIKDYNENRQTDIDKLKTAWETAVSKAETNLQNATRTLEDRQASYDTALMNYSKSMQQANDTAAQNEINATTMLLDINTQKEAIDKLKDIASNNYILHSDIEGTVSGTLSTGSVTDARALVSIMDAAKGFDAKLNLKASDAERVKVGDECQVTTGGGSMYFNPTVTGIISSISQTDENGNVNMTVRLPDGSWSGGQRVDVQTVFSRITYDNCIPISALYSDNSGYFVYVVESKVSVLGIENIVAKIPVSITASDDNFAAIGGPIGRNSEIITGSNKAISAGDRVRVNVE